MKLTAAGKPFGEKKTKAEVMESIRQTIIEIGEICGVGEEEVNRMIDTAIKVAEENE